MKKLTLKDRIYLGAIWLWPLAFMLGGCTKTVTVTKEIPVEVKIPVSSPCVSNRPGAVTPLRDRYTYEEWQALTTDQRENLVQAQALDRKAYGDKLDVATAGCR